MKHMKKPRVHERSIVFLSALYKMKYNKTEQFEKLFLLALRYNSDNKGPDLDVHHGLKESQPSDLRSTEMECNSGRPISTLDKED